MTPERSGERSGRMNGQVANLTVMLLILLGKQTVRLVNGQVSDRLAKALTKSTTYQRSDRSPPKGGSYCLGAAPPKAVLPQHFRQDFFLVISFPGNRGDFSGA